MMRMHSEEEAWLLKQFIFVERLGISVPGLTEDWDSLSRSRQLALLTRWENIRCTIPDHVKRLEEHIKASQLMLDVEEDFITSCRLNSEIAEMASRINDLHIWFRTQQDVEPDSKRHS
jgi:hypothetical protein